MQRQPFEAQVRKEENLAIIVLNGEINATAEEALNQAYSQANGQGPSTILLNFENVSYINSTGIALIVGLLAQARKSHKRLVVYGLNDHYEEIFRITRLADFMTIYPDESSAMSGVAA
jgi:anti-anti-sigma factor